MVLCCCCCGTSRLLLVAAANNTGGGKTAKTCFHENGAKLRLFLLFDSIDPNGQRVMSRQDV